MNISCPNCGQNYEIDSNYIGQKVNCQICNHEFLIQNENKKTELKEIYKPEEKKQETGLLYFCPTCGGKCSKNAEVCPHCGEPINIRNKDITFLKSFKIGCGVVLALICAVFFLFVIYCMFIAIISSDKRENARILACESNLKHIGMVAKMFAGYNNDRMPKTFEDLRIGDYLTDKKIYICPSTSDDSNSESYLLIPGLLESNSPDMPLIIEKIGNHDNLIQWCSISGDTRKIYGDFKSYSDLLPEFKDITENERDYLKKLFSEWDIQNQDKQLQDQKNSFWGKFWSKPQKDDNGQ